MPLAFPSHQGLIAPLWRRWPTRFQVLGCCVGAAVPDVVDGVLGLLRGHLGQGYGHSLIGLLFLCLPAGLALNAAIKGVGRVLDRRATGASLRWLSRSIERWSAARSRTVEVTSVGVGAFSHLVFDFVSHGNFLWLYPWYQDESFFPAFWYTRWAEVRLPVYEKPYPLGPHFAVWAALSIAGAWMLLAPGSHSESEVPRWLRPGDATELTGLGLSGGPCGSRRARAASGRAPWGRCTSSRMTSALAGRSVVLAGLFSATVDDLPITARAAASPSRAWLA